MQPDSSNVPRPVPAILRSALIPGWGQIYQERLLSGMAYYAASVHFYYQAFYRLHQYHEHDQSKFYDRFLRNLGYAAVIHVGSMVDAGYVGYAKNPQGWQGELLGDKPLKSPWGATLRSAMIPGWGQLYNRNYFKALIYFSVDGYLFYKILEADDNLNKTGIPKYRDRRSRYSWYFGLAYLITMLDAHVGAYLYKFDEAMKLALGPGLIDHQPGIRLYVEF